MSHIVEIKTEVKSEAAVQAACRRLELPPPVHETVRLFSETATGYAVRLPGWRYPVVCDLTSGSLQRFPDDREVLARGISLGLRCLASLADEEGRRAEALSIAARWRAFCHDQVPDGDGVTPMHREAADADMTTISMLRQAGDNDAAIALLDEAAPFIERLYAAEPALYDNAILQARALRHRGQLLVDAGDPAGAMPCFADQIAVLESWKNSEPQAGLVKALLDEAQGFLAQLADRTASTPAVSAPE